MFQSGLAILPENGIVVSTYSGAGPRLAFEGSQLAN